MAVYTVVKKIGATKTPTTMQFSTLQGWEDAEPADLTTAEKSAAGTFVGTFTAGESLTFTGSGATGKFLETDGSTYIVYGLVSGNPAASDAITGLSSAATCVLSSGTPTNVGIIWRGECYNQGNLTSDITFSGATTSATCFIILTTATGASFRDNASVRSNALTYDNTKGVSIEVNDPYHEVIQLSDSFITLQYLQVRNTNAGNISTYRATGGTNHVVNGCILKQGGSTRAMQTVINSLIITDASGPSELGSAVFFYNVTNVRTGTAGGTAWQKSNYSSPTLQNCASFNFTTLASGSAGFAAASDYNATDLATAWGVGTHNLNSLTYASQFVSTSDWRAVSSGSLQAGTPDSTNAPVDISNFTRNAVTPYIGAWEAASAGAAFIAKQLTLRQAANRASTY